MIQIRLDVFHKGVEDGGHKQRPAVGDLFSGSLGAWALDHYSRGHSRAVT